MISQNLHTHTVFDDGKSTPAEMAEAALAAGLSSLGFSGHSFLPYENDWSLTESVLPTYLAAVRRTQAAFSGRLAVYSGLEWDGISPQDTAGFEYVIGSLHHIAVNGRTLCIDESPAATRDLLAHHFGGSRDAMAAAYFSQYGALAENPAVDIIGHFDLLSKFDETGGLFDAGAPAYRDSAMAALETLVKAGKIFEVNTGAIARGWRTVPYPAPFFLRELKARRARVLLSSDAHSADSVAHAFPETAELLRSIGFDEIWQYTPRGFEAVKL